MDTPPRWTVVVAVAGAIGVCIYVAAWAIAGALIDGFDPTRQAISETFAVGVDPAARWLVTAALIVTGVLLVLDAPALHRALPGTSPIGPALVAVAGLGTTAVAFVPCSAPGCPTADTSAMDTAHVVAATVGYLGLMLAPVAFAVRVRGELPRFSTVSYVLGGLAIITFLVRGVSVDAGISGLQQRLFNTLADAWYVAAAVEVVRLRRRDPTRSRLPLRID